MISINVYADVFKHQRKVISVNVYADVFKHQRKVMSVNVYADVFKHQRKVSLNVECAKWRVKSEIISSQC